MDCQNVLGMRVDEERGKKEIKEEVVSKEREQIAFEYLLDNGYSLWRTDSGLNSAACDFHGMSIEVEAAGWVLVVLMAVEQQIFILNGKFNNAVTVQNDLRREQSSCEKWLENFKNYSAVEPKKARKSKIKKCGECIHFGLERSTKANFCMHPKFMQHCDLVVKVDSMPDQCPLS